MVLCECALPIRSVRALCAFLCGYSAAVLSRGNRPLSARQQAHSALRASALDCRKALVERRKRCKRRLTPELCLSVRLAGGWPAGRTEFACHSPPEKCENFVLMDKGIRFYLRVIGIAPVESSPLERPRSFA